MSKLLRSSFVSAHSLYVVKGFLLCVCRGLWFRALFVWENEKYTLELDYKLDNESIEA